MSFGAICASSRCNSRPWPYHCHLSYKQLRTSACSKPEPSAAGTRSVRHHYINMLPIACLRLFSILPLTTTRKPCIPTRACCYILTAYTSHLSPVKQYVYELNNIILPNIQSDPVTYKSVDTVVRADGAFNYPTYFKYALSVRDREQGQEREPILSCLTFKAIRSHTSPLTLLCREMER
jgi:hypothetical protein